MNIIILIGLGLFLAAEVITVLHTLAKASQPRESFTPEEGCIGGGVLLVCFTPVVLLLVGPYPDTVKYLAGWLAATLVFSLVVFVRDVHGVRGEKTPLSTSLYLIPTLVNLGVIIYLFTEAGL